MATRWTIGTALAGLLAAAPGFAQDAGKDAEAKKDPPFVGKVKAENVNIRMMPGRDGKIVRVARDGETVVVVGREKGWYQVVAPDNAWCWVGAAAVKRTPEGGATIKRDTPLRADSRANAAILGTIEAGAEVKVLADKVDWVKIQAPKTVGFWISENFVDYVEAHDPAKHGAIEVAGAAAPKAPEPPVQAATPPPAQPAPPAPSPGQAKVIQALNDVEKELMRIEEERKQREAEILAGNAPKREEKFMFEGWVDTVGLFIGRPGAHQLTKAKKTVCYLKPGDAKMDLNKYYNKFVGVNGKAEPAMGFEPLEVITVESIKVLTKD